MRKFTITLFAIFLMSFKMVDAQEYHPLIESEKSWDMDYYYMGSWCPVWFHRYFYDGKDTVVGGTLYSKIDYFKFLSDHPMYCPPYYCDTIQYTGYLLYEDTTERKVFIKYEGEPVLLYDFSLAIGDTFVSQYTTEGIEFLVTQIDEIELLNGEMRKRWTFLDFNGWYGESSYIEGIGLESGLFSNMIHFEWVSNLLCVQINDVQVFGEFCYGWVGQEDLVKDGFLVFPNPAKDLLRITIPENCENRIIRLYDVTGHLLFQKEMISANDYIDISRFSPGMYFLYLQSGDFIHKQKVVIK